jgi:hypothetical protein
MQTERIYVGVLLLAGFLWLRARARRLDDAARMRALWGSLLFLIPALLGVKWAVDRLPLGRYESLAVEMLALAATIAVTGLVFMRTGKREL